MINLKRFINYVIVKLFGFPNSQPAKIIEQWKYDDTWTIRQLKLEATGKGIKNVRIRTKRELINELNDRI